MYHEIYKKVLLQVTLSSFRHYFSLHTKRKGELCIMHKYEEVNAWDFSKKCRMDVVATFSFGFDDNNPVINCRDNITIGFEVKANNYDLQKDHKFTHYLGYTDYFYFAVPPELVCATQDKLKQYPEVGIIDITSGIIIKMPVRQGLMGRTYLCQQMLYCQEQYADIDIVKWTSKNISAKVSFKEMKIYRDSVQKVLMAERMFGMHLYDGPRIM